MITRDGAQLDLSAQVARVKARTRPWKEIIALAFAIAAGATSGWAHDHFRHYFTTQDIPDQIIAAGTAVAFCVFASMAILGLSGKTRTVLEPHTGPSHASIVRYSLVLAGAVVTLVVALALFGIPIGQLVLGGALTSVFVGIAAQQALSNVFAGMVLLTARPFRVGDAIRLRAGALAGAIDGTVTEIGISYVRISTDDGVLSVPNSQVLNAVVGPRTPSPPAPAVPGPAPVPATQPSAGQAATAADPPGQTTTQAATAEAPMRSSSATPDTQAATGSAAGPVGTADGAGGAQRPGTAGGQ